MTLLIKKLVNRMARKGCKSGSQHYPMRQCKPVKCKYGARLVTGYCPPFDDEHLTLLQHRRREMQRRRRVAAKSKARSSI
jgi:hypothetical protein